MTAGGIVHIIPMGLEIDRVLGGLKEFPTNRAIFLLGNDSSSDIEKRARTNGERIKKRVSATIDIQERTMDIFDFYGSTRDLVSLMEDLKREGVDVYVNISTGNRIISSAALLACYMTDSFPYYVKPGSYSIPRDQEVLSTGVESVLKLPGMRILGPSVKGRMVLRVLSNMEGHAKHESALLQPLEGVKGFFEERRDGESKRAYLARKRAHLSRVLRSLEKEGYISLSRGGRFVRVDLLDPGRLFAGPP